jgi:uncharacterized protein (UPF0335 family)
MSYNPYNYASTTEQQLTQVLDKIKKLEEEIMRMSFLLKEINIVITNNTMTKENKTEN